VHQIDRIAEVVEETLKGRVVRLVGEAKSSEGLNKAHFSTKGHSRGVRLDLPKIRKNDLVSLFFSPNS
jgi:hypothetical protein